MRSRRPSPTVKELLRTPVVHQNGLQNFISHFPTSTLYDTLLAGKKRKSQTWEVKNHLQSYIPHITTPHDPDAIKVISLRKALYNLSFCREEEKQQVMEGEGGRWRTFRAAISTHRGGKYVDTIATATQRSAYPASCFPRLAFPLSCDRHSAAEELS